jgi:hypothetical protein
MIGPAASSAVPALTHALYDLSAKVRAEATWTLNPTDNSLS